MNDDVSVPPLFAPRSGPSDSKNEGGKLGFTWFFAFFFCVLPCLLWGTAFFSAAALLGSLLIGIPALLLARGSDKAWRRFTIWLAMSFVTVFLMHAVDGRLHERAAPIAIAIEAFKTEAGHYPESLDMLVPKFLAEYPTLRYSLIQPYLSYGLQEGKPYLRIPTVSGDQFANIEYDFDKKVWKENL
ncbi:hypothetical protein [Pseudomonas sp. N040]|uniref:hypothetical protein n=1 Tax=Pseudomonas sp. N040 TaxID=2785325 RepID=UPI0018A2C855|nr:hypothetical protein [Pseudomonas sp. N040]MBF7728625.1 hypothetical protein [Pseudomonas sp. N040]MBW7012265.1 hypothetical protein [Pseudomonas sp. N040]